MTVEFFALRLLTMLCVISIFAQAMFLRNRTGTWLTPAALFALYWGLMTGVPFLLVTDAAPAMGAFIILLMVSAFSIGSVLVPPAAKPVGPQRLGLYDGRFLYLALGATTFVALICLLINSSLQGISFDRLFTLDAAAEYTENRYSGDLVGNIFIQLSTTLSYVAAVTCGLLLASAGRYRLLVVLLGLAPTLFVLVTQSSKGALLLAAALIAAGHFVRAIDANETRLVSKDAARRILFYVLAIIPLVLLSFFARGLYGATSAAEQSFQLYRYVISYTSGHLLAFDDWARYAFGLPASIVYATADTKPGFYTFMSIARALGDETVVPMGTYDDYFMHADYLQTNIYTMFRGVIEDFSFLGGLAFMAISGALAHMAYRGMTRPSYNLFAVVCFVVFIAVAQQSAYISLFQYNSPYSFGLVVYLLLAINHAIWLRDQRTRMPIERTLGEVAT